MVNETPQVSFCTCIDHLQRKREWKKKILNNRIPGIIIITTTITYHVESTRQVTIFHCMFRMMMIMIMIQIAWNEKMYNCDNYPSLTLHMWPSMWIQAQYKMSSCSPLQQWLRWSLVCFLFLSFNNYYKISTLV